MAGLAGLRLGEAGYSGAELVLPSVFAVIVATVVVHGFSLAPLARRFGLAAGGAPGLAIVGASAWSTDLAATLGRLGARVVLVDIYPGALDAARRLGIPVIQAEILSQHAEEALADEPVDYVLAATPDEVYNALVCSRLAPELGRERVYQIAPERGHLMHPEQGLTRDWRGKMIGDESFDYPTLSRRYAEGWRFAVRQIADPATSDPADGVAVLLVRGDGRLEFMSPDHAGDVPDQGDRLVVFARTESRRGVVKLLG